MFQHMSMRKCDVLHQSSQSQQAGDCSPGNWEKRKDTKERHQELLLERLSLGQRALRKIRWQISGSMVITGLVMALSVMTWLFIDVRLESSHRIPLTVGWAVCAIGMACFASAPLPDDTILTRLSISGVTLLCLVFASFEVFILLNQEHAMCGCWGCDASNRTTCIWFLGECGWNVLWNLVSFLGFLTTASQPNADKMQVSFWRMWSIFFRVNFAVDVLVLILNRFFIHVSSTAIIFIVGDSFGVLFSFFPELRHRLHAALHRYFKDTERTAAAVGVASLIGACDINVALKKAESQFRIIDCDMLQKHDLSDNQPSLHLFELSRPASLGSCDAFVSHSWRDDADAKWDALQSWKQAFSSRFGRSPSVWLDKACINQQDIEANLRSLPIFLSGCETLLILCGTTYLSRLWCILELFTFVHMGGKPCDIDCVLLVGPDQSDITAIGNQCKNFDASGCDCSVPADKETILNIIHTAFGTIDLFNDSVRRIMRRIVGLSADRFTMLSPGAASDASSDSSDSGSLQVRLATLVESFEIRGMQKLKFERRTSLHGDFVSWAGGRHVGPPMSPTFVALGASPRLHTFKLVWIARSICAALAADLDDEMLSLNALLMQAVGEGNYGLYELACDKKLSCFEPEAKGHLVTGLNFHKYYFDLKEQMTKVCFKRLVQSGTNTVATEEDDALPSLTWQFLIANVVLPGQSMEFHGGRHVADLSLRTGIHHSISRATSDAMSASVPLLSPGRQSSKSSSNTKHVGGVAWPGICMAVGFSALAAATKATGTRLSSYERIFLRSCFCIVLAPVAGEVPWPPLTSRYRGLLLLRGALGFVAVWSYYESIARVPLATLTLISRLHPLLSTALAGVILGEPVKPRQLIALLAAAFGTAMLVPRTEELLSSAQNSTYGYMCCVSAAFFTAAALLCVRTLSVLDEAPHHAREAFHWGNLCGSLALGLPHGFLWPNRTEMLWILATALSMQLAQLALTQVLCNPMVSAAKYFFLTIVLYGWREPMASEFAVKEGATPLAVDVVVNGRRHHIQDARRSLHRQLPGTDSGLAICIFRADAKTVLALVEEGPVDASASLEAPASWSLQVEVRLSRIGLSIIEAGRDPEELGAEKHLPFEPSSLDQLDWDTALHDYLETTPLPTSLIAAVVRGESHMDKRQKTEAEDHSGHGHSHGYGDVRRSSGRLPVTVLTGYLGAGKTTLLNYILKVQHDKKLAVIENEIGEVSIDDALVDQKQVEMAQELVLLDNGCVCCSVRGDLIASLHKIGEKYATGGAHLDGVLIELTGMADPAPVVQTFIVDPQVQRQFYVDNVVTLVDAKHAIDKLDESKGDPEKGTACAQIAFSSTVLLNKIDLVDDAHLKKVEARIKELNGAAEILRCQQSQAPMDKLFNVGAFNLERVLDEQYMDESEFRQFYKPKMDRSVSNVGIRCEGAVQMFAIQRFLDQYLGQEETAKDFLRVKAVLNIAGSDRKFVLQCVHMLRNQGFTKPWGPGEKRENKIIFIGRSMQPRRPELNEGFKACLVTKPLRFPVGTAIRAKTGAGPQDWEQGVVLAQWDECNAYRLQLRSGDQVHAPMDMDCFVMKA
ncbi:CBWD2 [Symbiodinium microadriaticum]|nr:CBWD2 [Symbiodinium microadriaticum]